MKRNKLQIEIKDFLNKSNSSKENKTNIILINHSKNKSVDLKHSFKTDFKITEYKFNNNTFKTKYGKTNNQKYNPKSEIRNINLLTKNQSVSNFLKNKNRKKLFFDNNFFNRNSSKSKLNISYKKNSPNKKQNILKENIEVEESENRKRNKRIIKINRNFNAKDLSHSNKKNKNEINNIKLHDILYDSNKKENKKKTKNKSDLVYVKSKINGIPYRNKICSTSRVNLSQKEHNIKFKNNNIRNINNIIEDSLDSHNTVVDENNINQYNYFQQNISYFDINKSNNDVNKSFKRVIPRRKNVIDDSLNKYQNNYPFNLTGENRIIKNYTPKTSRTNNEKYFTNYGINLNNNFIYKKVNTQRLSTTFNKNINSIFSSSLSTTRNQSDKYKDNIENIIVNKDVTEFVYSDDLLENCPNNKKINIKKWLNNLGLYSYFQNFYNKNIYDLKSLINEINKIKNKTCLFDYLENNYQIHLPGHLFRILIKIEIEEGEYESKVTNFFIKKEDSNNNLNEIKPSTLLEFYNNCDNFIDYSSIIKSNLKLFLKKYHLIHLYHNFYQNGFELINYVILQMYSKKYAINDYILENCFHIYNEADRILVLNALMNEKNKIDLFLNSNGYKKNSKINVTEKNGIININNFNYYNNFDVYFSSKESNETSCKICSIF